MPMVWKFTSFQEESHDCSIDICDDGVFVHSPIFAVDLWHAESVESGSEQKTLAPLE